MLCIHAIAILYQHITCCIDSFSLFNCIVKNNIFEEIIMMVHPGYRVYRHSGKQTDPNAGLASE